MKKFGFIATLLLFVYFIAGCSSVAVKSDYDTDFDFNKLKTFGFLPVPADAGIDQLSANRIGDALTKELTAKGYSLAKEGADFGIALHFGSKTQTNVTSYGYGYGRSAWRYGGAGYTDVTQYEIGSLIIDFIDMEKKNLVWRGTGEKALDSNPDVEEKTENINNAVAKILSNFPPEKK